MDFSTLYTVAFILIAAGIIIIIAVIAASAGKSRGTEGESKVRGAGVIMIGPIPIIFGTDKKSVKTVVVLALALTIVLAIWYYLMLR
jgi:uncharacterized protein (TIGR00304 family)